VQLMMAIIGRDQLIITRLIADVTAVVPPANERFDVQNKFNLVCLFDLSHLCRSGLRPRQMWQMSSRGTFLCNCHTPFVPH
jgi:hypothetical protein